ncbi:MAG: endonuclease [Ignavibacteriales bacterium]|nr:endonuclease [Ignavibacteriales bacterium]
MKHFSLFILFFISQNLFSQTLLEIRPQPLSFDTVVTNTTDSVFFWVVNKSAEEVHVTDINNFRKEFFIRDTNFVVPANDSIARKIYFSTKHNISFRDVVLFEIDNQFIGDVGFTVSAIGKYSDALYSFTQNLRNEELKTALYNFSKNHTTLGYNTARDRMFETIDDYNNDDTIECVYTGRKIKAATRTEAQNQNFNTEHTWPQSFFNSNDPMQSDLNHLFPTDETANSSRSNYPFGVVLSNITWQVGGSKLGRNSFGETVFEPREVHKGNVARALLYFVVRYDSNHGNFLSSTQEFWLRRWNVLDSADSREKARNNRIASFQNKRNPFIDHPEFVDRIAKFHGASPTIFASDIFVSNSDIGFGNASVGDTIERSFIIGNNGNAALTISPLLSSNNFKLKQPNFTAIPPDSFATVIIQFIPTLSNQVYVDTLLISSNDNDEPNVPIYLSGNTLPVSVRNDEMQRKKYSLSQNYPNPFNPVTVISYQLGEKSDVTLKVYDVTGKEVATLIRNGFMDEGKHEIIFDASDVPSGVYYYRLMAGEYTETKKFVVAR